MGLKSTSILRAKAKAKIAALVATLLVVTPMNAAFAVTGPAAVDDTPAAIAYNSSATGFDVLANDVPSDLETFDTSSILLCADGETPGACTATSVSKASGTFDTTTNAGQVTFTPAQYFYGTADTVTYQVTDTAVATVHATLTVSVTAPTAIATVADTKTTKINTAATIDILDNDTAGGESANADSVKLCASSVTLPANCTSTSYTVTGKGTFEVATGGSVTFTPVTDFAGDVTAIKYVLKDLAGQYSSLATITVAVVAAPNAVNDTSNDAINASQSISPLTNDTPANNSVGVALDSATLALCGDGETAPACTATEVTITDVGTATLASQVVTFVPVTDYVGTAVFTYVVADDLGQTDSATISFTVNPATSPITVTDDTNEAAYDVNQNSINVLANDTAATGETLTASSVKLCTGDEVAPAKCTQTTLSPTAGVFTVNNNGTISFNPANTFAGTYSVSYEVTDSGDNTGRATLAVTVTAPAAGTANDDTKLAKFNTSVDISVLTNDTKGDANLDATAVKLCASATDTEGCDLDTLTVDGEGTYDVNADGTITFTPAEDVSGEQSPVAYQAFDVTGQSAGTATITVTVIDLPTATEVISTAAVNTSQTVTPLSAISLSDLATANAVSLNDSSLKLCSPTQVAPDCNKLVLNITEGSVTLDAGEVTFDPATDFAGSLVVNYQVADSLGQVISNSITFNVIAPAVAADDESTDAYNTEQTIDVLANDNATTNATLDADSLVLCDGTEDGEPCSLTELEITGKGTFSVSAGQVVFTPLDTWFGTVTVDYEVSDDSPVTVHATLTVTVEAPAAPVLTADENTADFDVNQSIDVLANDTEHGADLDATSVKLCLLANLQCTYTSLHQNGIGDFTVDAETGEVSFNPSYRFWGDATVYYTVTDITGQTADAVAAVFTVSEPPAESLNTDYSAGAAEAVQTIDVLKNDRPGDSAFVKTSVKLCDDDQLEAADCDLTSYTVDGEGVYAVTADGKVTFTPEAAFEGEAATNARYTVGVTDGSRFGIGTIKVAVVDAPVGVADESALGYDVNHSVAVASNDELSDLAKTYEVSFDLKTIRLCGPGQEAPACTYKKLAVASVGIFTVDIASGSVLFNPSASFAGEAEPVTYQIADTTGQAASSTLTVTVGSPSAATLVNDTTFGIAGAKQTANVLANDIRGGAYLNPATVRLCGEGEGEGDTPCSLKSIAAEGIGTYAVTARGEITFVPEANLREYVADAVSYQVADVTGQLMAVATYTPTVVGSLLPITDNASAAYDTNVSKNVLTNDTLTELEIANGVTLVANSVRLCGKGETYGHCTKTKVTVAGEGTYTLNISTSVVTFNPLKSFAGVATRIFYHVKDTLGQVAPGAIEFTIGYPAAATLTNDTGWSKMGAVQRFNLSKNDTAGGAALVAKSVRLCSTVQLTAPTCNKTSLTVTGEGTYRVNTRTGVVVFTPAGSFFGVATAVRYSIADITGQRNNIATLTVTVVGKPELSNDESSADYQERAVFEPLANDGISDLADAKGVTLVAASIQLCAAGQIAGSCDAQKISVAGEGTWRLNRTTKRVAFVPLSTFAGTTKAIKYQVSDSLGQTSTATLTAEIGYPTPSILVDDSALAAVGINKKISVLKNDLSLGAAINSTSVKLCSQDALNPNQCSLLTLTVAGEGTYTVDTDTGIITFKSLAAFSGAASLVTYTVADITGQRASMAAISVTVVDGPELVADTSEDDYNVNQVLSVLENDVLSDLEEANGVTIKDGSLRLCAAGQLAPNCDQTKVTIKGEGVYTVNATAGTITFNPDAAFTGATKAIKYQVKDTLGNAANGTAVFTVGVPDIGVLSADTGNVLQSQKLVVNVLANDTVGGAPYKASTVRLCAANELTGAQCSLTTLTVANQGTYKVDISTGKISFVSTATFTGEATAVRYSVADITGQKAAPETLTITVNAVL